MLILLPYDLLFKYYYYHTTIKSHLTSNLLESNHRLLLLIYSPVPFRGGSFFDPTRGDHGPDRPRKTKTFLLFIFLKSCGAAFMTFHEICNYTSLDAKKKKRN